MHKIWYKSVHNFQLSWLQTDTHTQNAGENIFPRFHGDKSYQEECLWQHFFQFMMVSESPCCELNDTVDRIDFRFDTAFDLSISLLLLVSTERAINRSWVQLLGQKGSFYWQ